MLLTQFSHVFKSISQQLHKIISFKTPTSLFFLHSNSIHFTRLVKTALVSSSTLPPELLYDYKKFFTNLNFTKKLKFLEILRFFYEGSYKGKSIYLKQSSIKKLQRAKKNVLFFVENVVTCKIQTDSYAQVIATMGCFVLSGALGFKKNEKVAFKIFEVSTALKNPYGINRLAYCYLHGIGTTKNETKAAHLLKLAATLNDIDSLLLYAKLLNNQSTLFYLKSAANLSHKYHYHAFYELALFYECYGGKKDCSVAFYYYHEAAKRGCGKAADRLAQAYLYGELGKTRIAKKAIYWNRVSKRAWNGEEENEYRKVLGSYFFSLKKVLFKK